MSCWSLVISLIHSRRKLISNCSWNETNHLREWWVTMEPSAKDDEMSCHLRLFLGNQTRNNELFFWVCRWFNYRPISDNWPKAPHRSVIRLCRLATRTVLVLFDPRAVLSHRFPGLCAQFEMSNVRDRGPKSVGSLGMTTNYFNLLQFSSYFLAE